MRINIHSNAFKLTGAIARHVESRIKSALASVSLPTKEILVRFTDVNGDRGGIDKACRIIVRKGRRRPVIVTEIDSDLYAAVNRAALRLKEAVHRRQSRRRSPRRNGTNRPWRQLCA